MTDPEINAAIAEARGWTWMTKFGTYTTHHFNKYTPDDVEKLKRNGFVEGRQGTANECDVYGLDLIPDCCNDLNAMASAMYASLQSCMRNGWTGWT